MNRIKILSCVGLWIFLAAGPAVAQSPTDGKAAGPPPALVVSAPVTEGTVKSPLTLIGTAEPRYLSEVASEIDGLVSTMVVRKGQAVAKGDPLVKLRTKRQEILLEEARSRLREVLSRIDKAKADVKRVENLFQQKFISEEELEDRTMLLDTLEQQADQNRAAIGLLEDRLDRMVVRAPFAGRIVAEKTEVGEWLEEGETALILADLSIIQVMVPVPEQQIVQIKTGSTVNVSFDALPNREFTGKVRAIVPLADPASRTFPLQVDIANPDGRILGGMLARAIFSIGAERTSALVPKDALVSQAQGGSYVVRIVNGQAEIVPVRVLVGKGDQFAVDPLEGELKTGDRVIIRGNERLRPGQPVRDTPLPGQKG